MHYLSLVLFGVARRQGEGGALDSCSILWHRNVSLSPSFKVGSPTVRLYFQLKFHIPFEGDNLH